MAATSFRALAVILYFSFFQHDKCFTSNTVYSDAHDCNRNDIIMTYGSCRCDFGLVASPSRLTFAPSQRCITSIRRTKLPLVKWTKHGLTSLVVPGHDPPLDITVYQDISKNPGPQERINEFQLNGADLHTRNNTGTITYSRESIFSIRRHSRRCMPDFSVLQLLKSDGLLRFRGCRAGRRRIPVLISARSKSVCSNIKPGCRTLVEVPIVPTQEKRAGRYLKLRNCISIPTSPILHTNVIKDCVDNMRPIPVRLSSCHVQNSVSHHGSLIPVRITTRRQTKYTDHRDKSLAGYSKNNLKQISIPAASTFALDRQIKFCLWNAQSIRNKSASFTDYICDKNIDMIALTETWFTDYDAAAKAECIPDGYKLSDQSRSGRRGGGTALVYRSSISVKKIEACQRSSFEISEYILSSDSWRIRLAIVYRPPYSTNHPVTLATFISEFAQYLESFVLCTEPILVCGDFNIHVDNSDDPYASALADLCDSMDLLQHVHSLTQLSGHTLDLIITRKMDSIITSSPVADCFLSDHSTVLCDLNLTKSAVSVKKITYRKLKSIDMNSFKNDLRSSELCQSAPVDLDGLVDCYNTTLTTILDKHAPLCSKVVAARARVPWFSDQIRSAKRNRRKAERRWRTSKLDADWRVFKVLKNRTTYLMNMERREFYSDLINENSHDQRKLFSVTGKLLNRAKETPFPPHSDKTTLANDMGLFFVKKIINLRACLDSDADGEAQPFVTSSLPAVCSSSFSEFEPLDTDSVRKLILQAPTKSCALDPAPTNIVKECLDDLLPTLTFMINSSLQSGTFPSEWKEALVMPLLKKVDLDLVFKNFRPVSNLSFVSKLVEKAAAKQMHSYMTANHLFPLLQSAYRQHHSTETALLKVKNDILMNMDEQHVTLLVLLDLSAAFDTVDHTILLDRLHTEFGISGSVFNWFSSYLSNRSQSVTIEGVLSEKFKLDFGVPQGSCLGPLLFVVYASKLFKIIESHLPNVHTYADDTQLYLAFKPGKNEANAVCAMESCIADIRGWMHMDKLKLNTGKTEFIIIGTRQQLNKVKIDQLCVGDSIIKPSPVVKNLGSWFDSKLNMLCHISKTCSSSFFNLYNIRRIRKYLTRQATESLVHAFITSKVDYCNSLLYGLPKTHIGKLQRVQNSAGRLVSGSPRFCRITPVLNSLHWLPIKYRIDFKLLLLTFKCLYGVAPKYLADLLTIRLNSRYNLRSCNAGITLLPTTAKFRVTLGDRAFAAAAPKLWNSLPPRIRSINSIDEFKAAVKTYLFKLAFN